MKRHSAMMRRLTVLALTGLLLVGLAVTASAHETREVEDEFEFVVGFMNEPAYVNQMNGLDLRISYLNGEDQADDEDQDHGDDQYATEAEPVENAHQTLRVSVQFAGETRELELREVWGQPGAYTGDILPTETGAYSFQIMGEIDGVEINETFNAGPETFSEIQATDDLEFPEGNGAVADDSDQAAAFGIAGVVAGFLGLLAGGAAYYKVNSQGGERKNPAQQRREQKLAEQRRQQSGEQE